MAKYENFNCIRVCVYCLFIVCVLGAAAYEFSYWLPVSTFPKHIQMHMPLTARIVYCEIIGESSSEITLPYFEVNQ